MFLVTTVNGRPLSKPVDFRGFLVSPLMGGNKAEGAPGDVWELRGIESGSYHGVPPEVTGELYPPGQMSPAMRYNFGFGFYTEFRHCGSCGRAVLRNRRPGPQ
jgi:hypothetical protein